MTTRDIHITDTTFRDGQQARPPYKKEQMVKLFEMMSRLGGPHGVISSSDYHIFHKQNQTRQQAMDQYVGVVEAALEAGIRPRCHLEDVTRADLPGFVLPFVQKLERLTENQPETMKVKIRLCDTMGFGLSYPNCAEPRSIPKLIWRLRNECGNPPLEAAVVEYIGMKGSLNGIDLRVVTEMVEYYEKVIGTHLAPNYPFVGKDFNTTRAGIHAGGLRKFEQIYNIFDTTALLNRPPRVSITDKSGTDGVALWVNEFLGLKGDDRLTVMKVAKIQRWVMDQYEIGGRMSSITDEELEEQVKLTLPDYYAKRVRT